jgi:hypothetical protein
MENNNESVVIETVVVEPDPPPVPNINDPSSVPNVIQNSDFLYKSDIKWEQNIEYIEPNMKEIEMLKGTKKPEDMIKEESLEIVVEKTEEEIKKQKTKDLLLIFKVVSLDRMGKGPIQNTSHLSNMETQDFLKRMNLLIEDYNNGKEEEITNEFNKICLEKIFNTLDVSNYPVYS